jgi:hypothetical protein
MHVYNLIMAHMYSMHSYLPLNPGVTIERLGVTVVHVEER